MHTSTTPTVLITGASGGLGAATCRLMASHGWRVCAADLNTDAVQKLAAELSHNAIGVAMDVTDADSVQQGMDAIAQQVDGLDAVVNFAGIVTVGSVAEVDAAAAERILAINVMGTYRVNQTALPLILQRKGRFINISSETGWQVAAPFNGLYAMSKHAVEAYSDALRREMAFHGISVVKIQPGPFKTGMVASLGAGFDRAIEHSTLFKPHLRKIKDLAMQENSKAHSPDVLAQAVYHAITTPRPKAAYSIKADPGRAFVNKLPTRWADFLIRKVLTP